MALIDNNVLSSLAKIERLGLLPAVFDSVATPSAVVDELNRAEAAGYQFVDQIDEVKTYNDGWLEVVSPSQPELSLADKINDHALSATDAHCIAIADSRGERLVTDDAHAGTIARQRGVEAWDLVTLIRGGIRANEIANAKELESLLDALQREDNYRFTETDRQFLFEPFDM